MGADTRTVSIGNVIIGDGHPAVLMAELGTFYNQDVDTAIAFIDAAVNAGSRIVKTEILHDADVCLARAGASTTYNHLEGSTTENYRALIERKVVSLDNYKKIFDHARSKNVPMVASVYDFAGIDFMVKNGGAALKLWRNNYNNFPLIRYAAQTGLPIIFDAAQVYIDEIMKAVRFAQANGAGGVIVNHHPGKNPALPEDHNLRILKTYKELLNVPVGLSCHYRGDEILYVAVGAGVNIIEKGVFSNPDIAEQNVISAASFNDLAMIIKKMDNCWKALGNPKIDIKEPRDKTLQYGLVTRTDIKKGDVLTFDNVRFAFPIAGISVEDWDKVEGRTSRFDIAKNTEITWKDVEF